MIQNKKEVAIAAGVLVCLMVGAGLEHARLAMRVAEPSEPADSAASQLKAAPTVRTITVTNNAVERAANDALRRRVAELEQALAARGEERVQEPANPPAEQRDREDRSRRQSFTERLEQLKSENPEQYDEMQKRREEFRQSMTQRAQDRAEFVSAVDTKNMTDEQRVNHEKLVATVARVNELMSEFGQPGVEHTPDMHREIGEAMGSLGELYASERRFLFEETARSVGYQDAQQVTEFADQMQVIIDNTTMSGLGRHGGRDGGGRGGPPVPAPAPGAAR